MNKYNILKSKNEYVNYTINNFLNCYNDLSVNDIPLFTELFKNLKDHQISIGNHLVDGMPLHGVKLNTVQKAKCNNCNDLLEKLKIISTSISADDKKDLLFFQSVSHLCQGINSLDNLEMMCLNEIFQTVSERKQTLSDDTINNGEQFFFPYKRYPQKTLK